MNEWIIEYYSEAVREFAAGLPVSIRTDYARIITLIEEFGANLRLPHSKAIGGGLFELRPKGKEGIARMFYCTMVGKRVVLLHGFIKKTNEIPNKELKIALSRLKEVKNERTRK